MEKNTFSDIDNDFELIDLDAQDKPEESSASKDAAPAPKKGIKKVLLSPHFLFFVAILLILLFIFLRFSNWGTVIDLEDFFSHHEVEIQDDTLDTILPLVDEDGKKVLTKNPPSILFFGNGPFAERDKEDSVVNLIQKKTGATVYNFAVNGSYLASHTMNYYLPEYPMDPFCMYWMMLYLTLKDQLPYDYHDLPGILGDRLPAEFTEILPAMDTIDMNTIDVIAIMYDSTDYYMGNTPYNDDNFSDVTTFNGNLEASIEWIQEHYPHIRIIVMSPAYAYALDENGEKMSSDLKAYKENYVLSSYVTREGFSATSHGASFVDNLYGSITEDNAPDYLEDHVHLNAKGRQLIADRFVYALEYYSE